MSEETKDLSKRIEVLLSLEMIKQEMKLNEKIKFLNNFELDNKSIARILGISENHVAKEKSLMKKKNE